MTPAEEALEALYVSNDRVGVNRIINYFYDWADAKEYNNCEEILQKADFSKLSVQLIYSLASAAFGLSSGFLSEAKVLEGHKEYADRAYVEIEKREGKERADKLMAKFRKTPDGYKSMSKLTGIDVSPESGQQILK